jgi:DNA mismatch repair protein MutS
VALITLMAHTGAFVPASRARIGLVDRIFTRVGASDELARGQSTFMVEMTEAARILNNATSRSLVILDEVGRGTSTFDGVSIAWSICEFLHDRVQALVLFATHYHELTALADVLDGVANLNVAVTEWGGKVTFLRRIVPGGTDKSYGLHVAQIAGVPPSVVRRAEQILDRLESEAPSIDHDAGERPSGMPATRPVQLPLFATGPHPVVEAVEKLELDEMTPMQALQLLHELKKRVEEG